MATSHRCLVILNVNMSVVVTQVWSARLTWTAPHSAHCWATFLRFSSSRPLRASRAPCLANRTLVPAPIPELAPVIKATFPLREDTWSTRLNNTAKEEQKWRSNNCQQINEAESRPIEWTHFQSVVWRHEGRQINCGNEQEMLTEETCKKKTHRENWDRYFQQK